MGVNVVLNQLSAINKMCVGKLKKTQDYLHISSMLIDEIKIVAGFHGIKNLSNYEKDVMDSINLVSDDGITSMLQDIISNKRTEVDIFSGEILRLAKLYGVKTPYNEKIYCKIKDIEKDFL